MPLNMDAMKAATFDTPTNYTESVNYYEQNLQYKINETYQYASNTYEIGYEQTFGTLDFTNIVCRICHAINPKTGQNLGDDFKDLKFFNVFSERIMGERYFFDNSVWITTNTDNYHYNTQSAIVRRCNNTLNFIDSNGNVVNEPCIIGYSLKYANIYYNTLIEVPQGTIVVTAQNNANTSWIKINDRFIFGTQVFKVKTIKDYLRSDTYLNESVPLIEFEMFVDAISPDDDFKIGVANMNKYINIYPPLPNPLNGVIAEPENKYMYIGDTQQFSCYFYNNGEKQNVAYSFSFSGPPDNCYSYEVNDNNNVTITCLNKSSKQLQVDCISETGNENTTIYITLGGLY